MENKQDELLLTQEEQMVVNNEAIKKSFGGQVADLRTMMLEAQLAKVKQHYEQTGIHIIKGTEHTEEFDHSEQKRLDRPDREKIARRLADFKGLDWEWKSTRLDCEREADWYVALIPDIEELDKIRDEITGLNKKLDDREEDLIEAKKEGYEAVSRTNMNEIEEAKKQEREIIESKMIDCWGENKMILAKDWQALGEK